MTERKYSVAEIDRMRRDVSTIANLGGQAFEGAAVIEGRLRTYMLNGTEPEELSAEAERIMAETAGRREREQAAVLRRVNLKLGQSTIGPGHIP